MRNEAQLVVWREPGRGLVQRAEAWHRWAPRWLPSRVARVVRRQVLRHYQQAVVCQLPSGQRFLARPSDLLQCLVATTGGWEEGLLQAVRPLVTPGSTVLDIGAHVGYSALVFTDWVGAQGHVYCFEPMPEHGRQLLHNLDLNGVSERATLIAAAVAEQGGTLPFFAAHSSNTGMGSLIGPRRASAACLVTAVAIDSWLDGSGIGEISLAKIDVEGAETRVIQGMVRTLDSGRLRAALVELHPDLAPSSREQVRALAGAAAAGYRLLEWQDDHRFDEKPVPGVCSYMLAVRRDWAHRVGM